MMPGLRTHHFTILHGLKQLQVSPCSRGEKLNSPLDLDAGSGKVTFGRTFEVGGVASLRKTKAFSTNVPEVSLLHSQNSLASPRGHGRETGTGISG